MGCTFGFSSGYRMQSPVTLVPPTPRLLPLAARSGYRLQSPVALVPLTYHLRYDPEFKGRKDLLPNTGGAQIAHRRVVVNKVYLRE